MTYAPKSITDLAVLWTSKGGVNLGVVGDARHTYGYHCGRDRIYDGGGPGQGDSDYSVRHPRDRAGLTNAAAALDLGAIGGSMANLRKFSAWLVTQCQAKRPGYDMIREVIYTVDGRTVQRYEQSDGKIHTGPGNGDSSHLSHTHISFYRDTENRSKTALFAPYWANPASFSLMVAANANVHIAKIASDGRISGWTEYRWTSGASSAPCGSPTVKAGTINGSATVVLVKEGTFNGKWVRIAKEDGTSVQPR